ncbi:hypothetical protein CLCR_09374 [Cladophialophora carrionii]|uniref:Uncharacterized protein n=1 Tax=Cladophialophora carrionii TaxID=86049 RepID=A0A1C1CTT8_9EURO|nr:hypothetical protein CLCR_09374 [Cladophialophora carrionii]
MYNNFTTASFPAERSKQRTSTISIPQPTNQERLYIHRTAPREGIGRGGEGQEAEKRSSAKEEGASRSRNSHLLVV